jgi:glucan phosphoethanolaminetransferase (alkaline phosphatase superfamily)
MKTYGKALAALAFAVIFAVQAALSDGHITPTEWVGVVIALFGAGLVWLVPIHPEATWVKTAIAASLAGLNVVAVVIAHGISTYDLTTITLAVLTALGVGLAPSVSTLPAAPPTRAA